MTGPSRFDIPSELLQPLWLRSRESLADDRLLYDPVAAVACSQCTLTPECLRGNVTEQQLLHASLTLQGDRRVQDFLRRHPNGVILNLGGGLDTRFYRIDNGRCRWFDIDVTEHLLWRQRLFHRSERYRMLPGSLEELDWLQLLPAMSGSPVMLVCDQAMLAYSAPVISGFLQSAACHFGRLEMCLVLAGDWCASPLADRLGVRGHYGHALRDPQQQLLAWLPWAEPVGRFSPFDTGCRRWRLWQRCLSRFPGVKYRLLPVLLHIRL